jgi:hypothetical protein
MNGRLHSPDLLRRIRWIVGIFILGLVLSGATAIPIETELNLLLGAVEVEVAQGAEGWRGELAGWLMRVEEGVSETNARWPFMAYGGDWLAFGHFMIALAFVGAWRDPVRNRWLFDFGLMACALVIPYALIFGGVRGIPWWWRLIDCSFGVLGAVPLLLARRWTGQLERQLSGTGNPAG